MFVPMVILMSEHPCSSAFLCVSLHYVEFSDHIVSLERGRSMASSDSIHLRICIIGSSSDVLAT